jgi:3-dehydroquinate dehydratase
VRGKAVRGAGLNAGAKEAAAVLTAVWLGSQVTKALRAGLALALAPLMDVAINRVTLRTGVRRKAVFAAAVLVCAVVGLGVMGAAVLFNA